MSKINKFKGLKFTEENIEDIYRNNLLLYRYELSDIKYKNASDLIYNEFGLITNDEQLASYSSEGFSIQEKDFLESELQHLLAIDLKDLNYGEKQKFLIYKDYIELKIKYQGWYHVKSRNGFYTIQRSGIDKYKKGIYSFYFKDIYNFKNENGVVNQFYYAERTKNWRKQRNELLKANENLASREFLLSSYLQLLSSLMNKVVKLFSIVDKYDGSEIGLINSFNITKSELLQLLRVVGNYSQNINHNINTGHYRIALEIQHFFVLMFDDIIEVIESSFYIRVNNTPLKQYFEETNCKLSNAIDLAKLDFLLRLDNDNKSPMSNNSNFNLEENNSIFKTLEGQIIFNKFYNVYKSESTGQQSKFSFLFYALSKFNLINCSTSSYISFCKECDIAINTVVSRMKYENLDDAHPLIIDYKRFSAEYSESENKQLNKI
ncbi:hypothetical protein [Flavobacterium tistrianum]|uniref:hypothetical protein n=1 Tax=Flavobacterium tistrianum TaxID=1685414 RepID=UPI000DABEFEB|nr:hypothetical protein [Flavobacterium tistrianum]KAF2343112.1 hypothetical protein DMB71_00335 [Flavobacterium tistrianum]